MSLVRAGLPQAGDSPGRMLWGLVIGFPVLHPARRLPYGRAIVARGFFAHGEPVPGGSAQRACLAGLGLFDEPAGPHLFGGLPTERSGRISGPAGNDRFALTALEGATHDQREEAKPGRRGSAPAVPTTQEDRHASTRTHDPTRPTRAGRPLRRRPGRATASGHRGRRRGAPVSESPAVGRSAGRRSSRPDDAGREDRPDDPGRARRRRVRPYGDRPVEPGAEP